MFSIRLLQILICLIFICSGVTGLALFNIVNLVSHPINSVADIERGSGRVKV